MRRILIFFYFLLATTAVKAQKVDRFIFNLYTDSLKKGTHNYINVDGKLSNGNWKPLTAKELTFSTTCGRFEGNDLILPENPGVRTVTVTASLKGDPQKTEKIVIGIKQKPDPQLPVYEPRTDPRNRRRRG